MSTALVTGGAGYVGSHTVLALARAGYDVVVYDNLSAGHEEAVAAVAKAVPQQRVTLVRGEIEDNATVVRALRESGASAVLHFAARLSVSESVSDPGGYYRTNLGGTLSVLSGMAEVGVTRLVFSSTAATFGEPVSTPIDETHPQQPINPYGETKLAVERALPHFERAYGLRSVALRYFNAAGADADGHIGEDHSPEVHVIPLALAAIDTGAPFTVFGTDYPTPDGTCIRDFVHVADLAQAHVLSLRALEAGHPSSAYNLGNGHGVSVQSLLSAIERVTGRPVPHRIGTRRAGDPARLVASSARIMRELGWDPRFDLDAIVQTAWQWQRAHPHGYRQSWSPE
jgi:UDP-glucose-4-epimerase GalE